MQYFNDLVLVAVTYMTNPNAPYRQIGDTTLDVYAAEFEKAASPMRSEAAAIHAAASPPSALFLSMESHRRTFR